MQLGETPSLSALGFQEENIAAVVDTLLALNFSNPVPLHAAGISKLLKDALDGVRPSRPPKVDFNAENAPIAAMSHLSACPDPRLKEVLGTFITHLHKAITKLEVSPSEWTHGIDFLTRVGQACNSKRQEFVLLSDILGISALVDALEQVRTPPKATPSTVLGPFHLAGILYTEIYIIYLYIL